MAVGRIAIDRVDENSFADKLIEMSHDHFEKTAALAARVYTAQEMGRIYAYNALSSELEKEGMTVPGVGAVAKGVGRGVEWLLGAGRGAKAVAGRGVQAGVQAGRGAAQAGRAAVGEVAQAGRGAAEAVRQAPGAAREAFQAPIPGTLVQPRPTPAMGTAAPPASAAMGPGTPMPAAGRISPVPTGGREAMIPPAPVPAAGRISPVPATSSVSGTAPTGYLTGGREAMIPPAPGETVRIQHLQRGAARAGAVSPVGRVSGAGATEAMGLPAVGESPLIDIARSVSRRENIPMVDAYEGVLRGAYGRIGGAAATPAGFASAPGMSVGGIAGGRSVVGTDSFVGAATGASTGAGTPRALEIAAAPAAAATHAPSGATANVPSGVGRVTPAPAATPASNTPHPWRSNEVTPNVAVPRKDLLEYMASQRASASAAAAPAAAATHAPSGATTNVPSGSMSHAAPAAGVGRVAPAPAGAASAAAPTGGAFNPELIQAAEAAGLSPQHMQAMQGQQGRVVDLLRARAAGKEFSPGVTAELRREGAGFYRAMGQASEQGGNPAQAEMYRRMAERYEQIGRGGKAAKGARGVNEETARAMLQELEGAGGTDLPGSMQRVLRGGVTPPAAAGGRTGRVWPWLVGGGALAVGVPTAGFAYGANQLAQANQGTAWRYGTYGPQVQY